ncbi:MAG: ATP-binding region ATPase domain protein [Frankiales bacterium]|nr:ATP-binding region ATPase domain protein [Frankiales bacterium]
MQRLPAAHRLPVAHEPAAVSRVRHDMVIDLTARDVPASVVDDAALVISELVGNAVSHGTPLSDGSLSVSWELTTHSLRLEVSDGGTGPARLPRSASPDAEGGRGLRLVDAVSRRWGVRRVRDGCVVWVELAARVSRRAPEAAGGPVPRIVF